MKKLLSILLCAVLVLSVVSFGSAESAENVLTIAMGTKPCLDLHWNAGSTGASLMNILYEGLYTISENSIELAGATSREVSEDGLTWTFHLREDAVWNDGQPVTAADYVFSMQRLVNPEVSSTYMFDYGGYLLNGAAISAGEMPVEELGVKAIDDYTLEIKLQEACSYFEAMLCYTAFYPLRADCVVEDGTGYWAWEVERSITNGKMKMVYCDEEQEIVLEKNPLYHDADSVALDKLVIKLVDDTNTTLQLFETGAVDLIDSFPSEESDRLKAAGYYHSVPSLYTRFLLVNNNAEALSDKRVRQALSMVIDREFLSDVILAGSFIAADTYVGAGFPGSSEESDFHADGGALFSTTCTEEDIAAAQALLAEAGYPGGEGFPLLTCSYSSSNANYDLLFQYLASVWEENLGITVRLEPLENATMTTLRDAGDFDITPQGWGPDWLDASNMLSIFVTGNFINAGRFSNEGFDTAYDQAKVTFDRLPRLELLHEAERILIDEMGIIPLYHRHAVALYREGELTNVKFDADRKVMYTDIIVTK